VSPSRPVTSPDPALHAPDQWQGRTLHSDRAARVGLCAGLRNLGPARPIPPHLAPPVQLAPTTRCSGVSASHQPVTCCEQPGGFTQLVRRCRPVCGSRCRNRSSGWGSSPPSRSEYPDLRGVAEVLEGRYQVRLHHQPGLHACEMGHGVFFLPGCCLLPTLFSGGCAWCEHQSCPTMHRGRRAGTTVAWLPRLS